MPNKPSNNPLFEALNYKDMEGLMKPTIHVDEFSSKMGDDDDIIVLSFFVRDPSAAKDLMNWFEKGYDFVLDADKSPGEIKPNRYLVYVELKRRTTTADKIQDLRNAGANHFLQKPFEVETLIDNICRLLDIEQLQT